MGFSSAKNLIPAADQLGVNMLMRKPDANVPFSRSAPPQQRTQSQKAVSRRWQTSQFVVDIALSLIDAELKYQPAVNATA